MKRVTLKDIARAVGVSTMTVSLALRNQGRVSPAMQRRIRSCAERLDYRPDPALSALMTYRHERQIVRDYRTIAFLTNFPTASGWKAEVYTSLYFKGVTERAEKLGYHVEPFWMGQAGMTAARACQILDSRGIKGLLVAPVPAKSGNVALDWSRFCAVSMCRNLATPEINVVDHNHYQSMTLTFRELRKREYRRIGYAVAEYSEEICGRLWSATLIMEQRRGAPGESPVNPLIASHWNRDAFAAWVAQEKPDVVVSPHIAAYDWLKRLGFRMPQDIGYVWLEVEPERNISGVCQHFANVGISAMDLLHLELMRSSYGIPSLRQTIGIDGSWFEGTTLRPA